MRFRSTLFLLAAAAPVALMAALWLRMSAPLPEETRLPLPRAALEEAARRHAAALGLDAHDARLFVKFEERAEARIYGMRAANPGVVALLHPGFPVEASLKDGETAFNATLNPHGHLLGFELTGEDLGPRPELPAEEVQAAAESFVKEWLGFMHGATVSPLSPSVRGRGGRYTFEIIPEHEPRARFAGFILMHGTRPVAGRLRPEFEAGFESQYARPRALRNLFSVPAGLITAFFVIYALVLYRRRAREKEAPKGRIRILVLAFALLGGAQIALNVESVANLDQPGETLPWYSTILAGLGGGLVMAVGGLMAGAAYGAGEGQIREGFPGKMTSFDALFAGHIRSRNVGRSVTAGATAAAWALLVVAISALWLGPRSVLLVHDALVFQAYGALPWAGTVIGMPLDAAFMIVAGLFMPLTFALRNVRTGWRRWAVLLVAALLVTGGFGQNVFVSPAKLLEPLLQLAVLIAPFFLFDLLAAFTATLLYIFALKASALAAVAPWMLPGVVAQLALATVVLGVLAWSVRTGETVSEDEVKPEYAKNLEQRLSMRSEISAAREAQLRLLPAKPPALPGLSIAASCRPTGDMGADFYDFFPIPNGRLVLFVASGGGLGVASALTIALAKGYLMSDLRRGDHPAATLTRLRRLLTGRLGEVAHRAQFALIRLDPATGLLEAARWGAAPSLWVLGRSPELTGEIEFDQGPDELPSASLVLHPGDGLIVHTEGLVSALEDQSPLGVRNWFQSLCPYGAMEAQVLHAVLLRQLSNGREKVLQRRLRSDLTAVVLRFEQVEALRRESAA